MIEAELKVVEDWVEPFIRRLRPVERRRLMLHLARGLRRRQAQRIGRQQAPDGSPYEPRKPRKGKRGRMFRGLRKARHFRAVADPSAAHVGFAGRDARIARIHSEGLKAKVGPDGPEYQYPARPLLGWADDDRDYVLDQVQAYLAERH